MIEDDPQLCRDVTRFLEDAEEFEPAGIAHDGISGLRLLREGGMDLVLLDLVLPVRDGIYVLEEWVQERDPVRPENAPAIIILSSMTNNGFAEKAMLLGADYFILKPFDIELLSRRMIDIVNFKRNQWSVKVEHTDEERSEPTTEAFAVNMLHRMEVGSNLKGYTYLKEAIVLCIEDEDHLNSITKWLYPAIAKEYGTTDKNVERAMRHAIERAWDKDSGRHLEDIFSLASLTRKKPTVGQTLNLIVEAYRIRKSAKKDK